MGADNLENFSKWMNYEQILAHYSIYVYPRPGYDGGKFKEHSQINWINAPFLEISSSFIRTAIKEKKNINYFLPDKVYQYIQEMHFYER